MKGHGWAWRKVGAGEGVGFRKVLRGSCPTEETSSLGTYSFYIIRTMGERWRVGSLFKRLFLRTGVWSQHPII